MKYIFRIISLFLIMACLILLGLYKTEAQATKPKIEIEDADTIWEMELTPSSNLRTIVKSILPCIILEYSDSNFNPILSKSSKIDALADSVKPRIIMEYTDSDFQRNLQKSEDVRKRAKSVPSRIVIDYCDSSYHNNLQKSDGLGGIMKAVTPGIILEYADFYFTQRLIKYRSEGEPPPKPSQTSSFTLSLDKGLNMISLPVKPQNSFTARSFAQQLGSTMVIRYDTKQDEFISFVPEVFTGNGFPIEGGQGYIVNQLVAKDVVFTGTVWSNAPGKPASSAPSKDKEHWAFVVCGTLYDGNDIVQNHDILVTVTNLRTGNSIEAKVGRFESGKYIGDFVNLNRKEVVKPGDTLEIRFRDISSGMVSKPIKHKVTPFDITNSYADIPLRMEYLIPEKSLLLQNYPNPFNPETWIPYQLKEDSGVVISIYNVTGQLVRTLNLGYRPAGFYTDKDHAAYWDGKNESGEQISSGVYFYTIQAGKLTATRKMIVAK